jgi:RecA-family ATPase
VGQRARSNNKEQGDALNRILPLVTREGVMADIGRMLLSKIISTNDLTSAMNAGIRESWFEVPEHRKVYKWVVEYFSRYAEVPTRRALRRQYPNYKLFKVPEPYDYYIDLLRNQHERAIIVDTIIDANEALDRDDSKKAREVLAQAAQRGMEIPDDNQIVSVVASEVKPRRVSWIWQRRIPRGKLTVVAGDAGEGKTTVIIDIIARLSRGRKLPFSSTGCPSGEPMKCLIMSAEDDPADTLVPRLIAAKADCDNVEFITGITSENGEALLTLPQDIGQLRSKVLESGAGFLLVDPCNAFLDGKTDSYKDSDIRRVLAPLSRLAEETSISIVLVFHLTKAPGGRALNRIVGSVGIGAAARSVLIIAPNPENEEERVLAVSKMSNAAIAPSLIFQIEGSGPYAAAKAKWIRRTHFTADQLVANHIRGEGSALSEAETVLLDLLNGAGGEMPAEKIRVEATAANISLATLQRAKVSLGVKSRKAGADQGNIWLWALPKQDPAGIDPLP